jgi:dolichol-phosphate mannosyltransferase
VDRITLVVPCFNEQDVLPEFHRRATALADRLALRGVITDAIYVDDCSRDRTWEILGALADADPRVRALRLARNRGHQIAVTAGLDFASGDMVVIMDADLQDPPEVVEAMLDLVNQGFDVVHAQRRTRAGETALKLATARAFYWLFKRVLRTDIVDNAGDFRAITRPVVLAVREFREPHRFLRGTFAVIGFRQTVLRYDRDRRFAGSTKYPLGKMVKLAIDAAFGFSSAPMKAIVLCAVAVWALSLVYLGIALYGRFVNHNTVQAWTSLACLMTFFTGLIMMSIAVVGAYVGRIFEQGQRHPLYWLDQARNIHPAWGAGVETNSSDGRIYREVRLSRSIMASHLPSVKSGGAEPVERLVEPKPEKVRVVTRESPERTQTPE